MDDLKEQLRDHIRQEVAGGFATKEKIATSAKDSFCDDFDPDQLETLTQNILEEELVRHRRLQADWPPVTDNDRLDAAFTALEEVGIVCRQNFSCCGTCGGGEIHDVMDTLRENGREVRGYAFYHMQDTESAAMGYGICLSYGSILNGEKPALGVAHEIVEQLQAQGLNSTWDGTWDKRIAVELDWKRRRFD